MRCVPALLSVFMQNCKCINHGDTARTAKIKKIMLLAVIAAYAVAADAVAQELFSWFFG